MMGLNDLYAKAERIACKYLRNRIRSRASEWLGIDVVIPAVGSVLSGVGWSLRLVLDVLIPFTALSLVSSTIIGIPVALLLVVALFTATCE